MGSKTANGTGNVIYTAMTRTFGGRVHGISRSSDGQLDIKFAMPGPIRIGTDPEQLFAAGWSASFGTSIALAAGKSKITLSEVTIDAEVDVRLVEEAEYLLSARFTISIPGIDRTVAQDLIRQAEKICPYSKATRGNIDVTLNVLKENV
jgi:Ohr subfamily peroxiredoxin